MENKKLKVAIYCRVGNKDQLDIREQEERIKKFCDFMNYEIYKVYSDNGFSASNENRPSYNLMLQDLKQERFNSIMTYKLDKICRSIIDFEKFLKLIKGHNCSFKTLIENIDTDTSSGVLFTRFITIMNQYQNGEFNE